MKRFLVFAGDAYYPEGGMNDFQEDFDTLEEARSFEAKIKEEFKSMEWIKCLDRMPTPYEPVLIFTTDMNQAYAWLGDGRWYYEHQTWFLTEVSHWMPLPPNPF
jgi:hypothetical protein